MRLLGRLIRRRPSRSAGAEPEAKTGGHDADAYSARRAASVEAEARRNSNLYSDGRGPGSRFPGGL
jgi:hypothetical protein